jgi:hypothetical protein
MPPSLEWICVCVFVCDLARFASQLLKIPYAWLYSFLSALNEAMILEQMENVGDFLLF